MKRRERFEKWARASTFCFDLTTVAGRYQDPETHKAFVSFSRGYSLALMEAYQTATLEAASLGHDLCAANIMNLWKKSNQ